jgi:integrase
MQHNAPERWTDALASEVTLPLKKKEMHFEWDRARFLAVQVRKRSPTANLKRTWFTGAVVGGGWKPIRIGGFDRIKDAEAAYALAHHMVAQIATGDNPVAKRKKDREEERARAKARKLKLGLLVKPYLDKKAKEVKPTTFTAAKYYLEKIWQPLHNKPIDPEIPGGIKRADVVKVLGAIDGKPSARSARSNLISFYLWAIEKGHCETSPLLHTTNPAKGIEPRERVLTDAEFKMLWPYMRPLFKLLLLTGCRRDELGALQWTEVNLDTGIMTIPGSRTKTGRELVLGLPPAALEILKSLKAEKREGFHFVFGTRPDKGFSAWSIAKLQLDAKVPLPHWTLHDLRRTMRSGLGRLKVPPHVAELAIGHVKKGLIGTYDKHKYQDEIAEALRKWARHVASITEQKQPKQRQQRRRQSMSAAV